MARRAFARDSALSRAGCKISPGLRLKERRPSGPSIGWHSSTSAIQGQDVPVLLLEHMADKIVLMQSLHHNGPCATTGEAGKLDPWAPYDYSAGNHAELATRRNDPSIEARPLHSMDTICLWRSLTLSELARNDSYPGKYWEPN